MSTRETRLLQISDRVVQIDNLRAIANHIYREYEKSFAQENSNCSFSILLTREDKVELNSSSPSIIDENVITSESRTESVGIRYNDYMTDQSIHLSLEHGDIFTRFHNMIEIVGEDREWVNGQLRVIEDIINGFEPQNKFFKKFSLPLTFMLSFPFGYLVVWLILFFILIDPKDSVESSSHLVSALKENQILQITYAGFAMAICGWIPASSIVNAMKKLWPSIELQIGPPHGFHKKRRRRNVITTISVILIPLAFTIAGKLFF